MATATLLTTYEPEAVPAPASTTRFYRPELDVVRLMAFLLVFMNHAGLDLSHVHPGPLFTALDVTLKSMHYGLCMFFFLSSYLISELLQMERERTGSVHLKAFYVRRMLRIWPLYFVFLLVVGMGCSVFVGWKVEPARLAAFTFLMGNWYTVFHGIGDTPIFPLWSISVEEQFYVIWPFLAKFGGIRGLVGVSILLLPVTAISLLILSLHGATREQGVWMNSFVQFVFFALGALLAAVLKRRTPEISVVGRVALFLAGVATWLLATYSCGISDVGPAHSAALQIAGYGMVGVGCVCILLSVLGTPSGMWPRWAVYLGKISYGLYVFHILSLMVVKRSLMRVEVRSLWMQHHHQLLGPIRDAMALGMAIGLAYLSYRFLESPFLRLKERFTFVKSRAV